MLVCCWLNGFSTTLSSRATSPPSIACSTIVLLPSDLMGPGTRRATTCPVPLGLVGHHRAGRRGRRGACRGHHRGHVLHGDPRWDVRRRTHVGPVALHPDVDVRRRRRLASPGCPHCGAAALRLTAASRLGAAAERGLSRSGRCSGGGVCPWPDDGCTMASWTPSPRPKTSLPRCVGGPTAPTPTSVRIRARRPGSRTWSANSRPVNTAHPRLRAPRPRSDGRPRSTTRRPSRRPMARPRLPTPETRRKRGLRRHRQSPHRARVLLGG